MKFFKIFLLLLSTTYSNANELRLEGKWVQVESGCNLELPEETIKSLPTRGDLFRPYTLVLDFRENNTYFSQVTRGIDCPSEFRPHIVEISGLDKKAYCGYKLETHGYYETRGVEIIFSGWAVHRDEEFYEGFGIDTKKVNYELHENADVLVTKHINQIFCGENLLVGYWTRPFIL